MKKIGLLLLLVGALVLVSCDKRAGFFGSSRNVSGENIKEGHQVVVIDGCEYIYYSETQGYAGYGFLAHKGDCKNPIHLYNKPIHDTIYVLVQSKK